MNNNNIFLCGFWVVIRWWRWKRTWIHKLSRWVLIELINFYSSKVFFFGVWYVGVSMVEEAVIRRLYSCRWLAAFCFWHIRLSTTLFTAISMKEKSLEQKWYFFLFLHWASCLFPTSWWDSTHIASIQNFFFSLYRLLLLLLLCPDCALCLYHWDGKSIHLTNNIFTIEGKGGETLSFKFKGVCRLNLI